MGRLVINILDMCKSRLCHFSYRKHPRNSNKNSNTGGKFCFFFRLFPMEKWRNLDLHISRIATKENSEKCQREEEIITFGWSFFDFFFLITCLFQSITRISFLCFHNNINRTWSRSIAAFRRPFRPLSNVTFNIRTSTFSISIFCFDIFLTSCFYSITWILFDCFGDGVNTSFTLGFTTFCGPRGPLWLNTVDRFTFT